MYSLLKIIKELVSLKLSYRWKLNSQVPLEDGAIKKRVEHLFVSTYLYSNLIYKKVFTKKKKIQFIKKKALPRLNPLTDFHVESYVKMLIVM